MRINFGPDFNMYGLKPELIWAVFPLVDIARALCRVLTFTSGCDRTHSRGSLHYKGLAFDVVADQNMQRITDELKASGLDKFFDIVYEGDHIHIEYDPKLGVNQ